MRNFGIPYTNGSGTISESYYEGILELMFVAIERFPELHPVSYMRDGRILNRYDENAYFYMLYLGNNDPELEFLPYLKDDSAECQNYLNSSIGFVDLSSNSLTKKQSLIIQCVKNRLRQKI